MGFVIHWNESAMDLHVFPIPIPPPTSLSTRYLWLFPVHQIWALVSCIQPGLVICFTLDNSLLIKVKEEHEKAGLKLSIQLKEKQQKLSIQKTKITALGAITSWRIDEGKWKQGQSLFSWAPKSLWIVTTAMKLKDTCPLGGKLWQA